MNYYCHYCDQRCSKHSPDTDWWVCKSCKVDFRDNGSALDQIQFHIPKEHAFYLLELHPLANKTVVRCIKKNPTQEEAESMMDAILAPMVTSLEPMLQNVTPSNVEQKLNTILLFL